MSIHFLAAAVLLLIASQDARAQEICINGIDDDSDGLIDLNDTTDCACSQAFVSVLDMIANPSFEETNCCPDTWSELYCAQYWEQATIATSDYFHLCDYFPLWIPTPLPGGGEACVGGYQTYGYQEYVGACLLQPMLTGGSYTMQMSMAAFLADNFSLTTTIPIDFGDVEMIIYGYPSCPTFPVNTFVCPDGFGWVPVGSVIYTPTNDWQTVTITFTPTFDVYAVIIGAPCDLPLEYGTSSDPDQYYPYFLYDEFSLSAIGQHYAPITTSGALCNGDMVLTSDSDSGATGFQWFEDGIAIPDQTDTVLNVSLLGLDEGSYQFMFYMDDTCGVTMYDMPPPVIPSPVIVLNDSALMCIADGAFQWYLNGVPIAGAVAPWHIPLVNGSYTVEVTNDDGCVALSAPYELTNVGLSIASNDGITVINPLDGGLLEILGATSPFPFELFDATGLRIAAGQGSGLAWSFSTANLPKGLYLMRLVDRVVRIVR